MLSQTFCYWNKQQSADSNKIQFHFILKCMKDQPSHFCNCFLVSKWIFQHHDRDLTKFHTGSKQPLVCVIIINFIYPTVKNNNTAYHAFGKYWMQARGFLNYSFIYCWPKVIYCSLHVYERKCTCLQNELKQDIKKKTGGAKQKSGEAMVSQVPLRIATDYSCFNVSSLTPLKFVGTVSWQIRFTVTCQNLCYLLFATNPTAFLYTYLTPLHKSWGLI